MVNMETFVKLAGAALNAGGHTDVLPVNDGRPLESVVLSYKKYKAGAQYYRGKIDRYEFGLIRDVVLPVVVCYAVSVIYFRCNKGNEK